MTTAIQAGRAFVIEGTDGSGKTAHVNLLQPWLRELGYRVSVFDFPRYGEPSCALVTAYLNGVFGTDASQVDPMIASHFYAYDRLAASPAMWRAIDAGNIAILNRYASSNLAHQGGKIRDTEARREFYAQVMHLEYVTYGIPRPALTIVLRMPSDQAQLFVDAKASRDHLGGKKRDIHEADLDHLMNAAAVYVELTELFPHDFKMVECVQEGVLLSLEAINQQIRDIIVDYLPEKGS